MKLKDFEEMRIIKDGITFSPRCTYRSIDEDGEIIGLVILETAEELYQKHLGNKDKATQNQPDKIDVRLGQIEDVVGVLATQIARSTLLQGGK